ncbi:MAG: pseudouridine-5'-phosphate glycosidase [Tissierellia bacterium]|nr:pseudouridine-5'-phosphate glycosidase [Tissierellia bacterium]
MNKLLAYLDISDEIVEAIDKNIPVVALESSVLTHGLPYPKNLETAMECADLIRANNCVPATLAVINGRIKVGLSEYEIEKMCMDPTYIQMSRKDLPIVVANKLNGSTTVATSIIIARMVGIKVLATAGIGGVHRYGNLTFDISRDLQEIATNDICLVCSGPKSILDIALTLEYLETFGVPVLGYKIDYMPSFYFGDSGYKLDYKFDKAEDIGKTIKTKWNIGLDGGVIVANPISSEYSLEKKLVESAVKETLDELDSIHRCKSDPTPLFIKKIYDKTEGKSLLAHMEIIKNNARLASRISQEIYMDDN